MKIRRKKTAKDNGNKLDKREEKRKQDKPGPFLPMSSCPEIWQTKNVENLECEEPHPPKIITRGGRKNKEGCKDMTHPVTPTFGSLIWTPAADEGEQKFIRWCVVYTLTRYTHIYTL
mmetsp:Transcript_27813/g.54092  ORF Transcript_27813/g.54092 Transcript_27813/m.54092 type:complete len:117 (-) Transcript_27813:251-601(-)